LKIVVKLTPDEFKNMLPEIFKELFDDLVDALEKDGVEQDVAKRLVASTMLLALEKEGKHNG